MTRRLQPLPTGTPAEGSIQVAGAPNGREQRVQSDCREAHAHYCGDPRAQCRGGLSGCSPWAWAAKDRPDGGGPD